MRNIPVSKREEPLPQPVETMFGFLEKLGYNPNGLNFKEFLGDTSKGSITEKYAIEVFEKGIEDRRSALMQAYKSEKKDTSYNKEAERKRKKTFSNRYGMNDKEYDRITSLLGSDTFKKIKEKGTLDSKQLIDLSYIITKDTDAEILENVIDMIRKDPSVKKDKGREAIIKSLEEMGMEFGKTFVDTTGKQYRERMFKLRLHSMYNFKGDKKHM